MHVEGSSIGMGKPVSCCHWKQAGKFLCLTLHWLWFLTWSTQIMNNTGSFMIGKQKFCLPEYQCTLLEGELSMCKYWWTRTASMCVQVWERGDSAAIFAVPFAWAAFSYGPQPCSVICYIWVCIRESHSRVWFVKQVLPDGILGNPMRGQKAHEHFSCIHWLMRVLDPL